MSIFYTKMENRKIGQVPSGALVTTGGGRIKRKGVGWWIG
jgi:hypothetical protein